MRSVFFGTQLHGPRLFGRALSPGHDVLAASVLTDPHNQAPGRCDFEGDPEQHREREKVQPAAMPGEQAAARPMLSSQVAPDRATLPTRSPENGDGSHRADRRADQAV